MCPLRQITWVLCTVSSTDVIKKNNVLKEAINIVDLYIFFFPIHNKIYRRMRRDIIVGARRIMSDNKSVRAKWIIQRFDDRYVAGFLSNLCLFILFLRILGISIFFTRFLGKGLAFFSKWMSKKYSKGGLFLLWLI